MPDPRSVRADYRGGKETTNGNVRSVAVGLDADGNQRVLTLEHVNVGPQSLEDEVESLRRAVANT